MASAPSCFFVELWADGNSIAGTVAAKGGRAAPFSGWLELLALLEVALGLGPQNGRANDQQPKNEQL